MESTLVGQSPEFEAVLRTAQVAAATDVAVLILGEKGVGKARFAQAIHESSARAAKLWIRVECASVPDSFPEYRMFAQADGGTLFLNGIEELSPHWQAKLLRFIETGECLNETGDAFVKVDMRLLTASSRDLSLEVSSGRLREDLFYLLNVVPLEIPALRERTGDVIALANAFLEELSSQHGVVAPVPSKAALKALSAYQWPGNVRELRNLCERLVVLHAYQEVQVENLPREIVAGTESRDSLWGFKFPDGGLVLEELEVSLINMALARTENNRTHAAALLGISRDALLYRMKKHALR